MKLFFLWLQIRALEATAQGITDTLWMVEDINARHRIQMRLVELLAEITRMKAEYRKAKRGDGLKAWQVA